MTLEGALRVGLRLKAGRIEDVRITSTRPDVAQALLQGRTRTEVQAAVPLLFSICARSQAAACALACGTAAGDAQDGAALASAGATVAAEMVREGAWQALLNWPRWMDEAPDSAATDATRAALAFRCDAGPDDAAALHLSQAVFGCSARQWLHIDTWAALRDWAAQGRSAAARFIHQLDAAANPGSDPDPVPFLPAPSAAWLQGLATQAFDEPGFVQRPTLHGGAAETGALARQRDDGLLHMAHQAPARHVARQVARLRELALLLAGRWQPALGALAIAPGCALAWVDNARGLLVHAVQLDGERVQRLRIVAPTEWNFHPRGALVRGLQGSPAANAATARQQATRLINSLDPCVACHVEIDDDA